MSSPEVVADVVRNLMMVGIPAQKIWVYERFPDQMASVRYDKFVPDGVNVDGIEKSRSSILGYDPATYVEVDFFGEDDTRSMLVRHVSQRFTKIINIPNMKDHGASGVTGCLKNIAYGDFSNVARSHQFSKTNTLSFIGTLATVETASLENRAADYGRHARRLAWRPVPALATFSFFTRRRFCLALTLSPSTGYCSR